MTTAAVKLWGSQVGAVNIETGNPVADFEYTPDFIDRGIEVAPIVMPLRPGVFSFPELSQESFRGLPGLLADALPDRFGNVLIDAWLASQGRAADTFDVVERLCYIGRRGMGALEFEPVLGPPSRSKEVSIDALAHLASEVLANRHDFVADLRDSDASAAVRDILLVGTSAGGARAKALIAWNPTTGQVRSGQVAAGPGFEYWILKFDAVSGNRDKELDDPEGFGAIEYAYYLMATAAGITMSESRLFEEGPRRHFMTRRFDRREGGDKLHLQSLGALGHFDFNLRSAHSYEQAFTVIRSLGLGMESSEEQFRRMVFNVVARNQDDHVKNIAFLMDRGGRWSLAPAFDVTYSYNPTGAWTATHQMSINGRWEGFSMDDLRACARVAGLKRGRADHITREVVAAVAQWGRHSTEAAVAPGLSGPIAAAHVLDLV